MPRLVIPQRVANLVFAAILLVVVACMAWLAWGFETPPLGDATLPNKFFPLVLLGFIAFCVCVYVYEYVAHGQSGGDRNDVLFASGAQARRGLLTLVAACASFVIWRQVGFAAAGLFAVPAIALAMGTRNLAHLAVIGLGAGVIYLVFTHVLGARF